MKNILRLSLISTSIFFILISCSDDPATAPDDKINPGVTEVIGSSGGDVVNDELTLSIPPGAFNEDHSISITDVANDGSFGSNSVSKPYKISGLPVGYSKPIKLKIKYNKPLSGVSLIAVGEEVFDSLSGTASTSYKPIEATDSAGYIVADLKGTTTGLGKINGTSLNTVDDYDKIIEGVSSYAMALSNHYIITYPTSLASEVVDVGAKLDSAYNIFKRLNLNYYAEGDTEYVLIKFQNRVLSRLLSPSQISYNLSWGHVQQHKYSEIKTAMGDELLERGFESFYPRENRWWLDAAVIYYAEELFTENINFKYPANFESNAMAPFKGIRAGGGINKQQQISHGSGLSGVIKYLVDDAAFGMQGISKTYNNITIYSDPMEALIQTVNKPLIEWHPDFFKKYVNNEVYDLPKDYFINSAQHEWTISSDVDTEKVYSSNNLLVGDYPDLSAKLFKINLNYPGLTETHDMRLSMKGIGSELGLSLLVFGIKNGNTVFLGSSYAQDFELQNLSGFYSDNMRQFLVVLVNSNGVSPFLGKTSIDLTIKVNNGSQGGSSFDLTNNKCRVSLNVLADFIYQTADTAYFITEPLYTGSQLVSGSFTGNTFIGIFDSIGYTGISDTFSFHDTITVTLNSALNMVTDIQFSGLVTNTFPNIIWKTGFTAANIPINVSDNTVFELSGPEVCNSVTDVVYSYENFNSTKDIEDFRCDGNSSISLYIKFFKE